MVVWRAMMKAIYQQHMAAFPQDTPPLLATILPPLPLSPPSVPPPPPPPSLCSTSQVRFSKDVRSMVVRRAMMKAMYDQHPATFPQDALKQLAYDGQNALFALRALEIPSPKAFPIKIMDERPSPSQDALPLLAYDGQSALFALRALKIQLPQAFPIKIMDERETQVAEVELADIKAAITPAATTTVSAQDALRALDVKLRDYAAQRFLLVKDKFFDRNFGTSSWSKTSSSTATVGVQQRLFCALTQPAPSFAPMLYHPTCSFLLVKDKFFDRNFGRVAPLPGGIEAWTGFNVSFRPIHNALALNLGACCAACMSVRLSTLSAYFILRACHSTPPPPPVHSHHPTDVVTACMVQPINVQPIDVQPINVQPIDVQPIHVQPIDVQPIYVQPIDVQPINVQPINVLLGSILPPSRPFHSTHRRRDSVHGAAHPCAEPPHLLPQPQPAQLPIPVPPIPPPPIFPCTLTT
ncbi:unnamed protein product [Closterium sp. Naga37s-1]|nr:unnamed protein product [Closterium sp. Naga37s-1]